MIFKALMFITLLTSSISFKTEEKKFLGENSDDGKVIYVDVSLNNSLKNNNPYLHFVNGETEQTVNLILDDYDIYHTESSISFNTKGYYEICCSTAFVTDRIDSAILSKDNYNYICVGDSTSFIGYGYYGTRINNPGATYKTQRIWFNNNNTYFYGNDNWGTPCKNVIGYFDNDKFQMITMKSVINTYNNEIFYYADLPSFITSVHFMRMSETEQHKFLIYQDAEIDVLSYGSCYFAGVSSYEDYFNINTKYVDGADATLLSMVAESYLIYGREPSNGCSLITIGNLFATWFERKSASSKDLKSTKILDYTGYSSNGNSYEGLEKASSFSVNEKWNTMCSQVGIDPNTGKTVSVNIFWFSGNTTKFILIIGAVSFFTSLGAIALIIFRKKRRQK